MATIQHGTIKGYDPLTHRATVQIAGSLAVWLEALPVSVAIPPDDVIAGRECTVIFHTDDNPTDAAVISVHNAVPGAGRWRRIQDQDADTYVHTEENPDEDKVRIVTAGVLTTLFQAASPHVDITGNVRISGSIGLAGAAVSPFKAIDGAFTPTSSGANDFLQAIIRINSTHSPSGVRGVTGEAQIQSTNAAAIPYVRGLEFRASHAGSGLVTDLVGCQGIAQGSGPATNRYGAKFEVSPLTTTATIQAGCVSTLTRAGAGTIPLAYGYVSDIQNSAGTITDLIHFGIGSVVNISGGVFTNRYGFYSPNMSQGTGRRPFWDAGIAGSISNLSGNRFRSNTAFGTIATATLFGSGDGVIHIADATIAPGGTLPVGGGILYSAAGALTWLGPAGTVTVIAPA